MAHQLLYEVVADVASRIDLPEPVVEFGSLQVEAGQPNDVRPLFDAKRFIGTDFRTGPGVDRVEDLRKLTFGDGEVGTALCLDTLEHCADPLTACRELHRVVKDGGVCLITSVMLIGIHAHPNDYWRFTPEGFRLLLEGFDHVDVAGMGSPEHPYFVFGIGTKGLALNFRLSDLPALAGIQQEFEAATGKIRLGPFRYTPRELASELRSELPRVMRERLGARLRPGRR